MSKRRDDDQEERLRRRRQRRSCRYRPAAPIHYAGGAGRTLHCCSEGEQRRREAAAASIQPPCMLPSSAAFTAPGARDLGPPRSPPGGPSYPAIPFLQPFRGAAMKARAESDAYFEKICRSQYLTSLMAELTCFEKTRPRIPLNCMQGVTLRTLVIINE